MDKELAKKMLFDIADVSEHLKIEFFLATGTCLGAYRERDFIDWDNDVDLCVKAEEFAPKFQLWKEAVVKKGYWMARRKKPFTRMNTAVREKRGKSLKLDMSVMFLVDDKRWIPGREIDMPFPAHLFENPERIDFLGRMFSVPTPVTEYLEYYYGSDYMIPKWPGKWQELMKKMEGRFDRHKVPKELR